MDKLMKLIYSIATEEAPDMEQIGGKGMSLTLMKQRNLPVPPGFILTVDFFEPWHKLIQSLPEWEATIREFPSIRIPSH